MVNALVALLESIGWTEPSDFKMFARWGAFADGNYSLCQSMNELVNRSLGRIEDGEYLSTIMESFGDDSVLEMTDFLERASKQTYRFEGIGSMREDFSFCYCNSAFADLALATSIKSWGRDNKVLKLRPGSEEGGEDRRKVYVELQTAD